jgi:hypothetical protein
MKIGMVSVRWRIAWTGPKTFRKILAFSFWAIPALALDYWGKPKINLYYAVRFQHYAK